MLEVVSLSSPPFFNSINHCNGTTDFGECVFHMYSKSLMLSMLDRLCSNLIIRHVLCECASVMFQFGMKMFLLWQAVVEIIVCLSVWSLLEVVSLSSPPLFNSTNHCNGTTEESECVFHM